MRTGKKISIKLLCAMTALATVLAAMPLMTFAGSEGSATGITTAEEFLAMDTSGSYKLENDITLESPYAGDFTGTFDGQGHTVTLNINQASQYLGMFKKLSGNAVIKNVITAGSVTADNKNYAGGIAGYADTSNGNILIENCKNTAAVSGKKAIGGILGAVTSSAGSLTISGCANEGAVTGTDSQVGGIVGIVENAHVIINCSNTGNISGKNMYAGIAGRASNGVSISNCYNTGSVTAVSGNKDGYAIVGNASSGNKVTVTNSYALDGTGAALVYTSNIDVDDLSSYESEADMKTADFAALLGDGYAFSSGNYPLHAWEVPTVTSIELSGTYKTEYYVGDELDTAGLEVTVYYSDNTTETITEGFDVEGFDSSEPAEEQILTVSYGGASAEYVISVKEALYNVTFNVVKPEGITADYTVEVKSGEEIMQPAQSNVYSLAPGEYTYRVTCKGCAENTGSFTVDNADKTISVKLVKSEETTTQNKETGSTDKDGKSPKTGDENNMSGWLILLAAAACAGAAATVLARKKKQQ